VPLLEGISGGGGAFSFKDGLDTAALMIVMEYSMGDVETSENAYPVFYLTRRFFRDSGGAGRYRGGVGSLTAVAPYKTAGMNFFLVEDHRLVPIHGSMGGYPGGSHHFWVGKQIERSKALCEGIGELEEILPQLKLVSPITVLSIDSEDVIFFTSSGGGGYGDPLNRDSKNVTRDVLWKFVSIEKARELYGVVFKPGTLEVDAEQTKLERDKIRSKRMSRGVKTESIVAQFDGDYIILEKSKEGTIQLCSRCRRPFSSLNENWKEKVPHKDLRMDETACLSLEMKGWFYGSILP